MARKFAALYVLFSFVLVLFSAVGEAQCRPTGKQRAGNAVVGSALGAGLGALFGGKKGALIGAASGATAGALTARDANCVRNKQNEWNAANERQTNPYNKRIAHADAPEPESMNGKTVVIRNMYGARDLEDILVQALSANGYSVIDREIARRNRLQPNYLLDVTVTEVSGTANSGGGSASARRVSMSGNGSTRRGVYKVAVAMIVASTGRSDPSRSAIMDVEWTSYRNANGYVTVANVSGYGSTSYNVNDPRTAAAQEAINHFFSLV